MPNCQSHFSVCKRAGIPSARFAFGRTLWHRGCGWPRRWRRWLQHRARRRRQRRRRTMPMTKMSQSINCGHNVHRQFTIIIGRIYRRVGNKSTRCTVHSSGVLGPRVLCDKQYIQCVQLCMQMAYAVCLSGRRCIAAPAGA